MIQATLAIYPLGQQDNEAIHRAITALQESGVQLEPRSMQTEIAGDPEDVFRAIRAAYDAAADSGGVVMNVTVSNACPLPGEA